MPKSQRALRIRGRQDAAVGGDCSAIDRLSVLQGWAAIETRFDVAHMGDAAIPSRDYVPTVGRKEAYLNGPLLRP